MERLSYFFASFRAMAFRTKVSAQKGIPSAWRMNIVRIVEEIILGDDAGLDEDQGGE